MMAVEAAVLLLPLLLALLIVTPQQAAAAVSCAPSKGGFYAECAQRARLCALHDPPVILEWTAQTTCSNQGCQLATACNRLQCAAACSQSTYCAWKAGACEALDSGTPSPGAPPVAVATKSPVSKPCTAIKTAGHCRALAPCAWTPAKTCVKRANLVPSAWPTPAPTPLSDAPTAKPVSHPGKTSSPSWQFTVEQYYYYYQLYTSRAKFDYASGDYVHGAQDHARALNYLARAKAEKKALG